MFNVLVIGLGRIGLLYGLDKKRIQPASHIEAISQNKKLKLIGVCDINKKLSNIFTKKYGRKPTVFTDYTKALKYANLNLVDIIVISVPDVEHYKILLKINELFENYSKQLVVFCEKPLTDNVITSKKIAEKMKKTKIKVIVNHTRRWSKIWNEANEYKKQIGKIETAEFTFSTSPENKKIDQLRDGIHIADILNWFKIEKVSKINRLKIPYFIYEFKMWGSKGKVEILDVGEKLNYYKKIRSTKFDGFFELKLEKSKTINESTLKNSYLELTKFLQGKTKLSTDLDDASKSMEIFKKFVYNKNLDEVK